MAALVGGMGAPHRPVLLRETIELLDAAGGGLFVDGTLGLGGHSEAILEASPETRVVGIDRDTEALGLAKERLARFGARFRAFHADFRDITRVSSDASRIASLCPPRPSVPSTKSPPRSALSSSIVS